MLTTMAYFLNQISTKGENLKPVLNQWTILQNLPINLFLYKNWKSFGNKEQERKEKVFFSKTKRKSKHFYLKFKLETLD